jgi:propanediol dehydratase small subunit
MTTPKPLSHDPQAVLDAWLSSENGARMLGDPSCLAAAFRAAAAQIAAGEVPPHVTGDVYWPWRNGRATAEEHLLAIATELEGANG